MFDCAKDVLAYHDDEVNLPTPEQTKMRNRRDANRDRVKKGLADKKKPAAREYKSQGSYAMKVMTQDSNNDYDIDDGIYFDKDKLVGDRGAEMSALAVRQMVRDAVDDGSFKTAPAVRPNCVRVQYDAGYHVDLPSYRRVVTKNIYGQEVVHHELAASDWKRSDARDVTSWFEGESDKQAADKVNGGQVRRIVREIKKYARSRSSWKGSILSGFGITKLVTECYRGDAKREDQALHDTMKAIRDRLNGDLVVKHPVTPDDTITKGDKDPKAVFLRDKLSDAIRWLEPTHKSDCTRKQALKCWDDVFDTDFFSKRDDDGGGGGKASAPGPFSSGVLKSAGASQTGREAIDKSGGGRYA